MTADPTQRLSAIDVLDEADQARLDEWGNRAVLAQPAADVGVDSGVVRRAGRPCPRCGGDQRAGRVVDLPRSSTTPQTGWRTC